MKIAIIINGKAGVGKDLFVQYVSEIVPAANYSSVDEIKDIAAKYFGYDNNRKNDRDRKFLSDFKALTTEYCDFSFGRTFIRYLEFLKSEDEVLFIHCREPEEIQKLKDNLMSCYTLLIDGKHEKMKDVTNNRSDTDIFEYDYDFIIKNYGTKKELKEEAAEFVKELEKLHEEDMESTDKITSR